MRSIVALPWSSNLGTSEASAPLSDDIWVPVQTAANSDKEYCIAGFKVESRDIPFQVVGAGAGFEAGQGAKTLLTRPLCDRGMKHCI